MSIENNTISFNVTKESELHEVLRITATGQLFWNGVEVVTHNEARTTLLGLAKDLEGVGEKAKEQAYAAGREAMREEAARMMDHIMRAGGGTQGDTIRGIK